MEWTKRIPIHFEEPLKQAGIFGEVDISHLDFEWIRGLPTLRATYQEFSPLNKDLTDHNKYPAAVVKLFTEYLVYFAYGEQMNSKKEKFATKKRSPICISRQERIANFSVTTEGELAAFSGFWLGRFVLPYAPTVLGYIYHGSRETATHLDHPGEANVIFPSHYVIGWLAELFPCLYHRCQDSDCSTDSPLFVMLDCWVANFPYPRLDIFLGIEDIFLSELALIMRTLAKAEM
ncbi:hypothetical protein Cgig2_033078 [Carnegiea gigantea]|uniref:Aminotransferase-like plant mobile domain-containing protein n=1 Tax=Carnegiea gigantea TaxID=171969 RepID=A0A9Q1GSM8_9CARY|nr:hypothetical protein Cgig2_033078 [Carnegiea gigantea]